MYRMGIKQICKISTYSIKSDKLVTTYYCCINFRDYYYRLMSLEGRMKTIRTITDFLHDY